MGYRRPSPYVEMPCLRSTIMDKYSKQAAKNHSEKHKPVETTVL